MKRLAILTLALAAPAYPISLDGAQNGADGQLDSFVNSTALATQAAFLVRHGHYAQCLRISTGLPENTNAGPSRDVEADEADRKLHDHPEACGAIFGGSINAQRWFASFRIDIREAPTGHGWKLTAFLRHEGTTYVKARVFGERGEGAGPFVGEEHDWRVEGGELRELPER